MKERAKQKYARLKARDPEGVKQSRKEYYDRHRRAVLAWQIRYRDKVKAAVIRHYGPTCRACDEHDLDVLTIDHVRDDGAEQRKQSTLKGRLTGHRMYVWLRDHKYPAGYQVLCANCNLRKQVKKVRAAVEARLASLTDQQPSLLGDGLR